MEQLLAFAADDVSVEAAHARAGLAEASVFGTDGQIADHVQNVPAADGVAGHHGDDRLGKGSDLALQVEHVQARHPVRSDIAGLSAHFLVASRAEGLVACAGENDDADLRVVARVRKGPAELERGS